MTHVDPYKPHLCLTCHQDSYLDSRTLVPAFLTVDIRTLGGVHAAFHVTGDDEEGIERLKASLALALHHIEKWEQDRKIAEVMEHHHV